MAYLKRGPIDMLIFGCYRSQETIQQVTLASSRFYRAHFFMVLSP